MNSFEVSQTVSSHSLEDEPGPSLITPELLDSLLSDIEALWNQYEIAKKDTDHTTRTKLADELCFLYRGLKLLQPFIAALDISPSLQERLETELYFSSGVASRILQ